MEIKRHYIIMIILSTFCAVHSGPAEGGEVLSPVQSKDTIQVNYLLDLSSKSYRSSPDEAIRYGNEALKLSDELGYQSGRAYAFKSIGMGYYFKGLYAESLLNWQQSLEAFQQDGDRLGVANMLNNLGAVYFNEGDDGKAIEYYLESLKVSEEIGDSLRIATALVNIGAAYFNKKVTHDLALQYYSRALRLSEALGDFDALGTTAVNIGEIYLEHRDYDSALFYFDKSLQSYGKSEHGNVAYTLNNIGRVYQQRGEFDKAIEYQQEALLLAGKLGAKLEEAQSLLGLGDTYRSKGDRAAAIRSFKEAKEIAARIGANYELKNAYQALALLYAEAGDYRDAFHYQTLFTSIKDTLYNAEMDKTLRPMALNFEISKKQAQIDLLEKDKALKEVDLQRQKAIRNAAGITGFLLLLMAGGLFNRYRYVRKTNKIIAEEKNRSERLLLNILPEETAEELKEKGTATPKQYELVSVLFTDFKGFTQIAEKLSPTELVEELNRCFFEFDKIIDRHGLEKIKTIGDAYMCAGGIPVTNDTHPVDIVNASLEIKQFMEDMKNQRAAKGEEYWELRIGIHTGPVVAGVVGKNKFAYDIWGDAVNTASRMESSGIPGKVNISGATYELIKDHFACEYRGKVYAKNKGEIDMYIVEAALGGTRNEERILNSKLNLNGKAIEKAIVNAKVE